MDRGARIGRRARDRAVSGLSAESPATYASTRDPSAAVGFGDALLQGLAPDGGLYLPTSWPRVPPETFGQEHGLQRIAATLLAPFVAGDRIESSLGEIT